jgi:hypothetical protein
MISDNQSQREACRVCGGTTVLAFQAMVLRKHMVSYFSCPTCGFHQTEKPYWLNEAYERPINLSDTGLVARNIFYSQRVSEILYFLLGRRGRFLDFAGGYGLFTRLMRDVGFDFYWDDSFAENIFAQGFSRKEFEQDYQGVTAFEVFEHFSDPGREISNILEISRNVMFSTELFDPGLLPSRDWWYYAFDHGQHIAFYSLQTMQFLAQAHGLHFYTDGERLHMFSAKPISQARFRLLAAGSIPGVFGYVKRQMKSKTIEDSQRMLALDARKR